MQLPLDITFRGMSSSPAVERAVNRWAERMVHAFDRIQDCHVWIELPHRHRQRGAQFAVKVALSVPGREIVASDEGPDVYLAVAEAFLAARRQLQDHARIRRGDVKAHAA